MIVGIVSFVLGLVLVSRAIFDRHRAGQPLMRYAMIWAAIVAIGFAFALAIDRHGS